MAGSLLASLSRKAADCADTGRGAKTAHQDRRTDAGAAGRRRSEL